MGKKQKQAEKCRSVSTLREMIQSASVDSCAVCLTVGVGAGWLGGSNRGGRFLAGEHRGSFSSSLLLLFSLGWWHAERKETQLSITLRWHQKKITTVTVTQRTTTICIKMRVHIVHCAKSAWTFTKKVIFQETKQKPSPPKWWIKVNCMNCWDKLLYSVILYLLLQFTSFTSTILSRVSALQAFWPKMGADINFLPVKNKQNLHTCWKMSGFVKHCGFLSEWVEATDPHQTDVSAQTLSDLLVNTEDSQNVRSQHSSNWSTMCLFYEHLLCCSISHSLV